MVDLFLMGAVLFLAYANGANDNFKGVATLFGSQTADYRKALVWATFTTLAGSLAAVWVSWGLVRVFSGKGLVPPSLAVEPAFLLAVGLGTALTVYLATVGGYPVSTTHALTGALAGSGWMAVGSQVDLAKLGSAFFLPLVVSPVLALGLASLLYPVFKAARERVGIRKQLCLCVGRQREPVLLQPGGAAVLASTGVRLKVGELSDCVEEYQGMLLGLDAQWAVDLFHTLSAGAVSFARGLNDTPKIAALWMAAEALGPKIPWRLALVPVGMALGGILSARRVAQTMSQRITRMNHGQGFTANLVTSLLVLGASGWGLPVSTTHVSCGALFGIGLSTGQGRLSVIRNVALSWLVTLPVAALLGAVLYRLMGR